MNINKKIWVTAMFMMLAVAVTSVVSASVLGERVLKVGYVGEDVMALQTKLNSMGFAAVNIDGAYGPTTAQAVTDLQIANGLTTDGIFGKETFQVLTGKKVVKTSRAGGSEPVRSKKVLDIVATAYAPGPHDNGHWGSLTHIGTQVRPGIIAVDPKVIPLGSRVYIQYPDGRGVYATAEDTCGEIKGIRFDVAMWSVAEAYDFGMINVKVYIVDYN